MKNVLLIPALTLALGLVGCASTGQVDKLESTSETNAKLLRENEHRLQQLETSMASLNSQVAQLNNRVYEVRTRNGKKTSMTVVPIVPPAAAAAPGATAVAGAAPAAAGAPVAAQAAQPANRAEALLAQARRAAAERNQQPQGAPQASTPAAPQTAAASAPASPAQQAAAASAPKGRMIDPAAAPTPIPAPAAPRAAAQTPAQQPVQQSTAQRAAGATGSVGRPVAGPSGTLAAQPAPATPAALPPIDLPPAGQSAAAPAAAAKAGAVPVPSIPASNLALPPEHPSLPPMGQTQASEPGAPQKALASPAAPQAASPAPAARAPLAAGEEAAYKQALNATLAGRTDEGLRLFHDFLQKYPHGRYAANADYWIGEGLYAQGKYQDALAQFQKVNDAYPQHHKNADALLKAGMTMSRLGDKAAAAEKYRALMAQFPNSEAARRARAMGVAR